MFVHRIAVVLVAPLLVCAPLCPAAAPSFVRRDADGEPLPQFARARLGTLRLFHPGSVDFKALTPDRRFLITATCDLAGLFHVWDPSTGQCVRQFGHAEGTSHAIQSPDGRRIVSVGPAGTFLWDVPSGRLVRQLEKKRVPDLNRQHEQYAFRDEKTLIALRQGRIVALDLTDGRVGQVRPLEEEDLGGLLSPDGKTILRLRGNALEVVDTATGKVRGRLRVGEERIIAFHPGGKVFAVGRGELGRKGTVQICDAQTPRVLRQWKFREGASYSPLSDGPFCTFVPGGNLLATPGAKGGIDLWDWTTGAFVRKLGELPGDPGGLTFSSDGKVVASGGGIGRMRVFDVPTGKELLPIEGPQTSTKSVRFIDGHTLVSTTVYGGGIFTWDVRTGRVVRSVPGGLDVLSPDGKVRARPGMDGTVLLLDGTTGKKRRLLGLSRPRPEPGPNDWTAWPFSPVVAFSPDSSVLAYADPAGPIRLWRVATGSERGRLGNWNDRRGRIVKCLTFSPDGRLLAAGGFQAGGRLEVWDTAKGKLLREVTVPVARAGKYLGALGGVEAVAFTPNGRAVAVGNSEGPVRLWEIGSGRQLLRSAPRPGAFANCTAVACSPNGRLVAAAELGAIVLWDVASGREVGRFRPTDGGDVRALAFSPDSRTLASGDEGPTILLWEVPGPADAPANTRP